MKTTINLKGLLAGMIVSLVLLAWVFPGYGAPPTKENPIVLKYAMLTPPTHFLLDPKTGPVSRWIQAVEEATGGRVKIIVYPSESLGKAKDMFDLARTGIADIAGVVQGYTPGYFPLTTIAQLPYPAPDMSFDVIAKAMWALEKQGLLDKKYKEVKVLSMDPTDQYQLFLKKEITKADELKGLKLRSAGGLWTEIMHAWGVTPVPMTVADLYMGLQRGIIEGLAGNWAAAPAWRTYEVCKYVLEMYTSCAPLSSVMNLRTWNSLPPDIQKAIDQVDESFVGMTTRGDQKKGILGYELYGEEVAKPLFIQKGVKVYRLSKGEMEQLRKAVLPLWDKWVNEMEGKGLPGKKVMKAYLAEIKKLGAKPIYLPAGY
jgi:TRAP-type transport system periplasmic protein